MRVLVRITKMLSALLALTVVAVAVWWFVPAGTRAIPGPHAVAELRRITLGGFEQAVLVRGEDRRNPVLLYVHGGPGSAHLPIARHYSGSLEKHFVVVHWDQRGAGASCRSVDWTTLSLKRIVDDTIELAQVLGQGRKIFLIGHSWGSLVGALAVQRRPDLFYAYVGTGQLVHRDRQEALSYAWVVEQATRAGDAKALAELATISPPYASQSEFALQRRWLDKYHGEIYAHKRFPEILPAAVFGREYTLADRLRYTRCFRQSLDALLQDRLHVDLFERVPKLEVPVFLFTGRHDYNTVWTLVEAWATKLDAPQVEMVWFEDAGHFLAIEAPEEFQARLIEKLLPLVPDELAADARRRPR
jgi:pimeloyl-ACP methyl ester carboxylesterase